MDVLQDAIEMAKGMTGKSREMWAKRRDYARQVDAVLPVTEIWSRHKARIGMAAGVAAGGATIHAVQRARQVGDSSGAQQDFNGGNQQMY